MNEERQLPSVLEHDFVITDESINRYGWRLLVSGIDLTGFLMNPVCCVQHATMLIPVGRWKNIRKENGVLKGTAEFDRNDPDAVKLYWKYTDGFMNAVSINIVALEESDQQSFMLPGQTRPTVTKSELLEISLVTIPGQRNAVKLSYKDNKPTSETLTFEIEKQKRLNVENLIALHKTKVTDNEISHLVTLGMSNYDLVKNILENRN